MNTAHKKHELVRGSATYLVTNVISAAIPFALIPVLTRHMNPEEYGQVAIYQTLLAALAAVIGVNVSGAASVKYYDQDLSHANLGYFIGACLQILMVTTVITLVGALLLGEPIGRWLGIPSSWVIWAVAVSAAGFIVQMRLGQWQMRGEAVKYGVLQTAQSLANAVLSLVLVAVLLGGAEGRIDAQNWVAVAAALVSLYLLIRDRLVAWSWRPEYLREALLFGVPLIPHVAGMFLLNTVDRIVIKSELGLAETGIYMVAVQLTLAMYIVFSAINSAYVPWLYERLKRGDPEQKRQIVRWTYIYFVVVLALAALAFVVGPLAVTVIAGEEYRAAGQVIGWLALGQAFGGMYLMVTNYIFFSKRTGMLSLATIGSGLLNVALLYLLIRHFGIVGAAVAFAFAAAVRFVLTWFLAQRRYPMPWLDFGIPTALKDIA